MDFEMHQTIIFSYFFPFFLISRELILNAMIFL